MVLVRLSRGVGSWNGPRGAEFPPRSLKDLVDWYLSGLDIYRTNTYTTPYNDVTHHDMTFMYLRPFCGASDPLETKKGNSDAIFSSEYWPLDFPMLSKLESLAEITISSQ